MGRSLVLLEPSFHRGEVGQRVCRAKGLGTASGRPSIADAERSRQCDGHRDHPVPRNRLFPWFNHILFPAKHLGFSK